MNVILRTLLIWLLFTSFLFCQNESSNWYFGFNAGIEFVSDENVIALGNGQLNTFEGCANVSDTQGNLLFYTDGKTVYDRQHDIMENGEGLFGQPSSTQSAIIVPKPESTNLYYIITTNSQQAENPNNGLNYTEVDMSLNNGNGAVTVKNVNLLQDSGEKVTSVIKDCTSNSIWLVALGTNGSSSRIFNTFHAFEIDDAGINLNSIESTVSAMSSIEGYLKFSLDGSLLASANMSSGLFLYDFDTATGIVSNEQEIIISSPSDNNAYGVEFSPNSNYLYVHASNHLPYSTGHTASLFQYNLQAQDISASQVILDQSRALYRAALQLGPNGKIYRSLTESYETGTPFLGVINNPNESGLAAQYKHNAVSLNGRLAAQGLPALIQSIYKEVEIIANADSPLDNDLELCVGDELNLKASYYPGAVYRWAKNDLEIVGETTNKLVLPTLTLSDTGDYEVTVYRPSAAACPLITAVNVVVDALPEVSPVLLTVCDNDLDDLPNGIATFNLKQIETVASLVYTYYESIENMNNDLPINTPASYSNSELYNQFVYYKVVNANGCENIDEIQLEVREPPVATLDPTYNLCLNDPILTVEAPSGFDSYTWFKIENTSETIVSSIAQVSLTEIGDYVLKIGNQFSNNGNSIICEQVVTFKVIPSNIATIQDVILNDNNDTNTIEIIADGEGDYEYSINGYEYQENNYFENVSSGLITVYVQDKNGCGIVEQMIEVDPAIATDDFPKFFTPNGDGVNDFWQYIPNSTRDIDVRSIDIYNRMGQLLIQLLPDSEGWDGSFNGRMLPKSDYWYKAYTMDKQVIHGHFSLIR